VANISNVAFMPIQDSVHWMKGTLPVKTQIILLHAARCYIQSQEQQPILSSNTMIIWVHTYIHKLFSGRQDR